MQSEVLKTDSKALGQSRITLQLRGDSRIDRAQEVTLKQNLKTVRNSIDQFHADHARDPADLAELVATHYLRELPVDPVTDRDDTWVPEIVDGGMHDLHSGAPGKGSDGTPYASW